MEPFFAFLDQLMISWQILLALFLILLCLALYLIFRSMGRKISGVRARADLPLSFGNNISWIAVKARDPKKIASLLQLENLTPTNWQTGLDLAFDQTHHMNDLFITPSVEGWVFLVSRGLPRPEQQAKGDECLPLLQFLSSKFGEAQYFCSFPSIDLHSWIRAARGDITRAYAWEDKHLIYDLGADKSAEQALSLKLFDPTCPGARDGAYWQRADLQAPSALIVQAIAGHWSLNPIKLDQGNQQGKRKRGTGFVASLPPYWPF